MPAEIHILNRLEKRQRVKCNNKKLSDQILPGAYNRNNNNSFQIADVALSQLHLSHSVFEIAFDRPG